jgi:hypothetical protein
MSDLTSELYDFENLKHKIARDQGWTLCRDHTNGVGIGFGPSAVDLLGLRS